MNSCIPETAYAIIIGSMKCGTSSLYSYMVQHPEICGARVKEPEFFSESQHHGVKVEKYSDLWDFDPKQHKIALEASTGYTKYPSEKNVPKNILSYGIRPKLIYIIRNPFDRIQSHFEFMSHYGSWKLNLLDEHLINTSNYFLQLAQYLNYFARDQILVLDFDDLKVDPTPLLNRTFQFLGLHPIVLSQDNITENRTQPLSGAERKLKRWGADRLTRLLPTSVTARAKKMLRSVFPPKKRVLAADERQMVFDRLNDDMLKFQETFQFDVGKWGFGSGHHSAGK